MESQERPWLAPHAPSRVLVETVALLHDFEVRFGTEFVTARDLSAINVLVDNRTFSSKLEGLAQGAPEFKGREHLSSRSTSSTRDSGVREHYDRLSEL